MTINLSEELNAILDAQTSIHSERDATADVDILLLYIKEQEDAHKNTQLELDLTDTLLKRYHVIGRLNGWHWFKNML